MIKASLSALALAAAFATSASAATVTFTAVGSNGVPPGFGTDVGDAYWTTIPGIVSGSASGQYRSPYGDGTTEYYTVGSPDMQSSPAVLTMNKVKNAFTMLWGSIDTYNAVTFCLGQNCATVTGSEIKAAANVAFGSGNAIVRFTTDFNFDTVSFFSNNGRANDQPAFEFAVAPVPVPLPAGGLLLLGALGGIAALRRRKAAV